MEIDRQLDQALETKSRQHNLTTVNVKNIIHVSERVQGLHPPPLGRSAAGLSWLLVNRRSSPTSTWSP